LILEIYELFKKHIAEGEKEDIGDGMKLKVEEKKNKEVKCCL
jgi:hypothetical protein